MTGREAEHEAPAAAGAKAEEPGTALASHLAEILRDAATTRRTIGGLYGSARSLVVAALAERAPVLAVVADPAAAEGLEDDLASLARRQRVLQFRLADADALDQPEARVDLSERLALLKRLRDLSPGTIALVPAALLLEELPPPADVAERTRTIRVGDTLDVLELRRVLQEAGFTAVPMIASPAEVSIRGDIVDLFPLGEQEPVRIELFDDQVESIRAFDLESQRSIRERNAVDVPLVRPEELTARAARASWLAAHLPPGMLVARLDPARLVERLEEHAFAHGTDRARKRRARAWLEEAPGVDLVAHRADADGAALDVPALSVQSLGGGVDGLADSLTRLRAHVDDVIVFAESDGDLRRLGKLLRDRNLLDGRLHLRKGRVRTGFQLPLLRAAWLNHLELLGRARVHRPRPRRPAIPARAIQNLLELTPGDHVVHLTHGVARYEGMTRMKRDVGEEEFLVLEFAEGTTFYLPTSKIDLVQRYVGAGGAPPKLDRIGGKSWSNKKARVEAALEELADELLDVQAAREVRAGTSHPKDDPLITEFEASFPYPDTPDQARSMREIHQDFDRGRPMDRLVCGDVGFGKTELAVRAAFRVVCGGRQVALLVPTTLLAEQHLATFQSRFAHYPVQVAALSRFRTTAEQKATLAGLLAGSVDIVIGTHRLLSSDVVFKDIGLIIVDEEQRFGVKAKEGLKKLRRSVDVLTLTATPIPRTLHMALVGIRDISSLNTPPAGRRPVRTEIRKDDPALIRRAILHELTRGGQVFFVHNRVRGIERVAERIQRLVPTARVVVAHGQMHERDLEAATQEFLTGAANVLVSTNIIESGLDLPHANTILIDRPEMFGLADLHQLRGRVGRSDVQAFCYLLVQDQPLPAVAEKRLKAVEELAHLGAGYDIAIKDLEIRGAGNLLGSAQHGHIAAVGYDLYVQLLRRAVARAQGAPLPREPVETDVDLGVEAFLPADYVPESGQRMEILRRHGAPEGPSLAEMAAELRDRFGRVPEVAGNLITVYALKRRCREIGVRRLLYPGGDHVIVDVENARTLRKHLPFPAGEFVQLNDRLGHLRVPPAARSPQGVLALLQDRLLGTARA